MTTEAQEEIKVIAAALGIDTAPFGTWPDAVVAIRGGNTDPTVVESRERPVPEDDDDYYDVDEDATFEPDESAEDVIAVIEKVS